ncbi:MAG: FliH/SctL family protein [Planctomycetota bacterium]
MAVVLKNENSTAEMNRGHRENTGLAGFNLQDLADAGREKLVSTQEQTRAMIAAAENEAAKIKESADRRGFEEGLAKGREQAAKEYQADVQKAVAEGLDSLQKLTNEQQAIYEDWMRQYSDCLSGMIHAACEKLLGNHLQHDPLLIARWVSETLDQTRSATQLTIAVHPETLTTLGQTLDELACRPDLPEDTKVEADERLPPGEIEIRQPGGRISAGLRARLDRLKELWSLPTDLPSDRGRDDA